MAGGGSVSISKTGHVLFFGFGFCAAALAPLLAQNGWQMSATLRDRSRASELAQRNIAPLFLDTDWEMDTYSHVLVSAPRRAMARTRLLTRWHRALMRARSIGLAICLPRAFMATIMARGSTRNTAGPAGRARAKARGGRAALVGIWRCPWAFGSAFQAGGNIWADAQCAGKLARGHGATHSQTRSGVFAHSCG